jgi:MoaA/NifB/PqqE/SkfB family radical SAM enzyme
MTMVLNACNYKKIEGMIGLAHELGISGLNIEPICVNNPFVEKLKLGIKEREEFLRDIGSYQALAKKYGIRTNLEKLAEIKHLEKSGNLLGLIMKNARKNDFLNLPCYEPWLWPKIEANGDVWPCSSITMHENIKNKSFEEIWFGKEFQLFRKRVVENNLPPDCSNCVMTHLATTKEIKEQLAKAF